MRTSVVASIVFCLLLGLVAPAGAAVEDAGSIEELLDQPDYDQNSHAEILRLYQAIFGRSPDLGGAKYWIDVNNQGFPVSSIAGFMAESQEWANTYAGTTNEEFVARLYTNVLGRDYDQAGLDYWLDLVDGANVHGNNPDNVRLPRHEIVFYVTRNAEFINAHPFASPFQLRVREICQLAYDSPELPGTNLVFAGPITLQRTGSDIVVGHPVAGRLTYFKLSPAGVLVSFDEGSESLLPHLGFESQDCDRALGGGNLTGIDPATEINWFLVYQPFVFEDGTAALLLPESQPAIDKVVRILSLFPEAKLEIGAHTDSLGPADANRILSLHRAEAVQAAIYAAGVANQLSAVGYGESQLEFPDDKGTSPEHIAARAANNRIKFSTLF